jgi:hypothetical protein
MDERERSLTLYYRELPDGFEVAVLPLTYGHAHLCYGRQGDDGYMDSYFYADPAVARAAAEVWDGQHDPLDGWYRHPSTGRRRKDGDPKHEYFLP